MKKIISAIVFIIGFKAMCAQTLYDKVWVQGGGVSFTTTFNGASVTNAYLDTTFSPYFTKGHSNVCNKDGAFILSSDGYNVYNNQNVPIDNGADIVPMGLINKYGHSPLSQSSIFLPFPNNKYYLITPTASDNEVLNYWNIPSTGRALFDLLLYNIIDMNMNLGQGKVIKKSQHLLQNVKLSKTNMMACRHGNGKDWWLFKQAHDTNMVYKFLVTTDSIYNYGTQGFAEPHFGKWDQGGQAMFTQQGDKYAVCVRGGGEQAASNPPPITPGKIFVSSFDRCSGILSNPKVYKTKAASCHNPFDTSCYENFTEGLCFSPNGRFIYIASYYNIKQLDLLDNDTNTQWSIIHGIDTVWDYCNGYSSMYLGPNNKIYVGHYNGLGSAMSVIDNPDVKGLGCNFCELCCRFPMYGSTNPPCMPNYHLGGMAGCWAVGNEELLINNEELLVYPNPASAEITVESESLRNATYEISLSNLLGEVVFKEKRKSMTNKLKIDISGLPNGMYVLRVNEFVRKVLKE